jgi:hypothetical protein
LGTFLAVVSLCLNIACFYWILILSQRLNAFQESDSTSNPEALQEQLDEHIERLRQENAQFLYDLEARLNKGPSSVPKPSFGQVLKEQDLMSFEAKEVTGQTVERAEQVNPHEPRTLEETNLEASIDVLETSVTAQILHLKEQGLSVDKIAKKLKMGTGEVALMLKLHEKR